MENLAVAVQTSDMSLWGLFWQAGFVVKLVMVGLLGASIWTWAIIIDKIARIWPREARLRPVRANILVRTVPGRALSQSG